MEPLTLALWILFLPLAAFTVQILIGYKLPRQGDWLPTGTMAVVWLGATYLFVSKVLLGGPQGMEPINRTWDWVSISGVGGYEFKLGFGILFDNITGTMLFVVTTVSFLVHVYSIGYMRESNGEPELHYNRFFAFLSLFTFSMLLLCLTNNLFMLYIAWELVGLCSYFLIGFYFQKRSAANASMKAFLTNRVGDFGFFIGILIIFIVVGSVDMATVFDSVRTGVGAWGTWTPGLLTAAGLCLFCGAVGKSAQFPLHIWLPDAMEGPTPVSALIHAATMVVAGVYMLCRLFPIFAGLDFFIGDYFSSNTLFTIATIGSITAFGAATIALVQTDIKKVLAYSTVSQLGYMVLAIGVGSVQAAVFHLFTHAFFKGHLFLGAGSVIHAVHSNEMKDMGGLRKKLPITYVTFLISTCAIAGVPFLSGFWSKEAIVGQALAFGLYKGSVFAFLPFVSAILTAGLTAFYMFRMFWLTFHGEPKDRKRYDHAHESPFSMAMPLCVLAFLAVIAGGVVAGNSKWLENRTDNNVIVGKLMAQKLGRDWDPRETQHSGDDEHASTLLSSVAHAEQVHLEKPEVQLPAPHSSAQPFGIPAPTEQPGGEGQRWERAVHDAHTPVLLMSLFMAFGGIFGSWFVFLGPYRGVDLIGRGALARYKTVLENLYYVDWFYENTVLRGLAWTRNCLAGFDKRVVDGLVNLVAAVGVVVAKVAGVVDYWGVDGAVRGTSAAVLKAGRETRRVQTGRLQEYVYLTVVLIAFIFLVWIVAGTIL